MQRGYQCESCKKWHYRMRDIFLCQFCEKEICEYCMDKCATCKECAQVHTSEEIEERFNS